MRRTEALFRSSGAFREGHFLLKSGRHGDAYVEKFQRQVVGGSQHEELWIPAEDLDESDRFWS